MNWPSLFRWAAQEFGWKPRDVLDLTIYQVLILQGWVGPDEHYVTMSYADYLAGRHLRRGHGPTG